MSQSIMGLATDRNCGIRFARDRLWDPLGHLSSLTEYSFHFNAAVRRFSFPQYLVKNTWWYGFCARYVFMQWCVLKREETLNLTIFGALFARFRLGSLLSLFEVSCQAWRIHVDKCLQRGSYDKCLLYTNICTNKRCQFILNYSEIFRC